MAEDTIKPSQRKTVKDAKKRRDIERMNKETDQYLKEFARRRTIKEALPDMEVYKRATPMASLGQMMPPRQPSAKLSDIKEGSQLTPKQRQKVDKLIKEFHGQPSKKEIRLKKGGAVKKGGKVRGDGICKQGKTKGRMV